MTQPSAPLPPSKTRNLSPMLLIAGGCGCLFAVCVVILGGLFFASSQGLIPLFATPSATPSLTPLPQPTSAPRTTPTSGPPPVFTPRATATSLAAITKIVLAKDSAGENKDPVDVTTIYAPTQRVFHAIVSVMSLPDNTTLKAVWYVVDIGSAGAPNSKIDEFELKTSGTRNVDFTLMVGPSGRWPVGKYKVEIYLNGKLDRTVNFTVQ